jgi:fatty-acyl-CoA synthase
VPWILLIDTLAGSLIFLVERHKCTHWDNVPTMVVDLLSHPEALKHDVTSLKWIFGGGAAMPEAIAQKLYDLCGVRYIEGYGMTETISQTHLSRPEPESGPQSYLRTEALIPRRFVFNGSRRDRGARPQLFTGYWRTTRPTRTPGAVGAAATRTGASAARTGRPPHRRPPQALINAAGMKVWPAGRTTMYKHQRSRSADEHRGDSGCRIEAGSGRGGRNRQAQFRWPPTKFRARSIHPRTGRAS